MDEHSAPAVPVFVHRVPLLVGHAMVPHAPAAQVTSHAHAVAQLTVAHALSPVHVTLHAAPEPQLRSSQAISVVQLKVHGTPCPHRRSAHAFIDEQVTLHDLAPIGQMVPLAQALALEHWIVHA